MDNKYHVVSHKFLGQEKWGYTYELTLTKSFVHTGRIQYITKALDYYEARESKGFWKTLRALYKLIKHAK